MVPVYRATDSGSRYSGPRVPGHLSFQKVLVLDGYFNLIIWMVDYGSKGSTSSLVEYSVDP
jgi:hypothetical protein